VIKLVSIVGESYNLETGQETKKALVLSNGIRQLTVEVGDEVIRDLIMMQLEAKQTPREVNNIVVQPVVAEEVSEEPADVPTMAAVADAPVDEDPGFEYADSSTGTASI
jgi:hypothetical protein